MERAWNLFCHPAQINGRAQVDTQGPTHSHYGALPLLLSLAYVDGVLTVSYNQEPALASQLLY